MKLLVVFGIVAFISFVSAATLPEVAYDDPIYELKPIEESIQPVAESSSNLSPIRHRRVTCDVLSFQSQWVSVNHSACAVRCLTQRRKGGRCENGVCVCRD